MVRRASFSADGAAGAADPSAWAADPSARAANASAHAAEADRVRFVECPRDAWQALPRTLPLPLRRRYLEACVGAGVRHLDAASFVSPRAVPQLADSERMLAGLGIGADVEVLAIVANARGVERALGVPEVGALGLPLSLAPAFERRNVGRDPEASWAFLAELREAAGAAGRRVVLYLSMAFGNPDGEPWHPERTAAALERARGLGQVDVVLADTVGRARAADVADVLAACPRPEELGLHLHARPDGWEPLLAAAVARGVRWVEGACRGLGGCPFAGDALVGNLPSERVVPWLHAEGLTTGIDAPALAEVAHIADELAAAAS